MEIALSVALAGLFAAGIRWLAGWIGDQMKPGRLKDLLTRRIGPH